ncbi:ATP-binding cassette domain-containing protein [Streptomyces sp. 5.8]|uniref:ATP-binding cassette domain-containing protein n=1 Tax=Streptomyces sp. 5.8 TaxID=3406571 RepID=UPI003BB4903B
MIQRRLFPCSCCVSPVTAGTLRVLGGDPERDGSRIRARLGVVPQDDNLDDEVTVRENLLLFGRYFGLSRRTTRERAAELLEFAQLTEKADAQVQSLSGGMKRRLTIARSMINSPEILILDEPTTGLDPQARHVLWERLYQLKRQGVTLILTTHYMDEAEQLCDRLVVMDHGRIVAEGSPGELITRHVTREVLEVSFATDRRIPPDRLDGLARRVEQLPDRVLLYTEDCEATLAKVHAEGLAPTTSLVRRATLEDVFLTLTGRTLVD